MKHLEEYRQAVSEPSDYARQLNKASGKKIIGYTFSYTPEEVIMAAGAHPLRLFGTKQNRNKHTLHPKVNIGTAHFLICCH